MKILLAEDSKSMMLTTTAIIKQSNHEVIQAHDGKQALSLYLSEKPDLVLLDVEMPGLNGFEVAEKIRNKDSEWIPIIFLTSHKDDEYLSQGINAGGDDYLTKPISSVVLNAKLKAMQRIQEMQNKLIDLTKELSKTNEKLISSITTDPLTGVKNRLYLDKYTEQEWSRGIKSKTDLSLLLIDLDNFKTLNDTNGHQAGDKCLIDLANLFISKLKVSTDEVCRYGGDEFVIVLPNTSANDASKIAEVIRRDVENYNNELAKIVETPVKVSVSIGCASCIPNNTLSYDEFLTHADKALYAAKEAGRNCVVKADIPTNNNLAA